jgi:hypothetical protein
MPRPARKTHVLTCRVTPEVKADLERAAKLERRSLAGMLEVMVVDWCDRYPAKDKRSAPPKGTC